MDLRSVTFCGETDERSILRLTEEQQADCRIIRRFASKRGRLL